LKVFGIDQEFDLLARLIAQSQSFERRAGAASAAA
jgi:hypothetical protein